MTLNSLLVQIPITIVLVVLIPLALILFVNKRDKELKGELKLRVIDIIIICAVAILYEYLAYKLIWNNFGLWLNTTLIAGYLVFSSYTDLKMKMLYAYASLAYLVIEILWLGVELLLHKDLPINQYSWTVLVIILVMFLMSIPRWIGMGDALIYTVISVYLIHYRFVPALSLGVNLLAANIMFVIITTIVKLIKHDKEIHQPLTVFIAISTICCCLLGI